MVFGVRDSNPKVNGAGARLLRSAGVEVVEGVGFGDARRLTQHFNVAMGMQRPFITLKAGMTLDGRIATAAGESRWITSKRQRAAARSMRRLFDGVLIGIETALKDNPLLLPEPPARRPQVRVVLDSHLRLPLESRLVDTARKNPLMVVCVKATAGQRGALEERGAIVMVVAERGGRVSIPAALRALFARGITSLVVEGGSEVMGSFVRERLFDELVIFRAPLIMGGRGSRALVGGDDPLHLKEALLMKRAMVGHSATLRYGLVDSNELEVEVYEPRTERAQRSSPSRKRA